MDSRLLLPSNICAIDTVTVHHRPTGYSELSTRRPRHENRMLEAGGMTEITALILAEHEAFGRRSLDLWGFRPHGASTAQAPAWRDFADRLEVHAAVEEEILYPALPKRGSDEAPEEALDAIGDHHQILDAIREAAATEDASLEWWDAVLEYRKANDEHLEEQERDIIPSFREHSDDELRSVLGREWLQFKPRHSGARGVSGDDVDSGAYVEENS